MSSRRQHETKTCAQSRQTPAPRAKACAAGLVNWVTPVVHQERLDYFGNRATHVVLTAAHTDLTVAARSQVEVMTRPQWSAGRDLPLNKVWPLHLGRPTMCKRRR
jgi:Bacterial transglutaminase-like N-terminal region